MSRIGYSLKKKKSKKEIYLNYYISIKQFLDSMKIYYIIIFKLYIFKALKLENRKFCIFI